MGEVYLAKHPRLPRLDALTVLPASFAADADYRARFARVADIASSLSHPNIVGVRDHGDDDGRLWISMDYVDGIDAEKLLAGDYPVGMPINLVLDIVSAVAEALDFANDHQILHRDVKAANIILVEHNSSHKRRIILADVGIARRTDEISGVAPTNLRIAAPKYAAPEQLRGEPMDGRADQYALAATTYTLLTNRPVFDDRDPAVVIGKHLNDEPPKLTGTHTSLAYLDEILGKALAKNPDDRYPRATDFSDALMAAHISHIGPTTELDSAAKSVRRWTKRKSTVAVLATVGIIATLSTVVAGAIAAFFQFGQPDASGPGPTTAALTTTTVPPVPIAPLTVRPIVEAFVPTPEQCLAPPPPVPATEVLMTCDVGMTGVFTLSPTVLELEVTSVEMISVLPSAPPAVRIGLTESSQAAFATYTRENVGGQLAFVRDGIVVWSSGIGGEVNGPVLELRGELTLEQMAQMTTMLRDGH